MSGNLITDLEDAIKKVFKKRKLSLEDNQRELLFAVAELLNDEVYENCYDSNDVTYYLQAVIDRHTGREET